MRNDGLLGQRRGAVSILFATMAIPLTMCVGLAVDFSFYIQAQSQLSLAADAGALHAVRVASLNFLKGEDYVSAGKDGATAGTQWFEAQLGPLTTGVYTPNSVTIPPVHFDSASSTFTSNVTYQVTIPTHFGNLFDAVMSWPLGGTSSAVITTNSFIRIDMLMDNSSSMLIGAEPSDIEALQNLTLCPPTSIAVPTGHGEISNDYTEYSWNFLKDVGFNLAKNQIAPNSGNLGGSCAPLYTGDPAECIDPVQLSGTLINLPETYLPPGIAQPVNANGYCPTGYGSPDTTYPVATYPKVIDSLTKQVRNIPQAPCGFACHSDKTPNDYYSLLQTARGKGAVINLRFDIIQKAAETVVADMSAAAAKSGVPDQFTLGIFTFNDTITQVHPAPGVPFVEADDKLDVALTDLTAIQAPHVLDQANTNFSGAMSYLASNVTLGGDGTTPTTPRKNLFIVTDGLNDYPPGAGRLVGQMTNPLNETVCQPLKDRNYTIYVLYTPYYPLPNPFYLDKGARVAVEQPMTSPTSVAAALQACASNPSYYYQASSVADINAAMKAMLASALNSPGRFAH